MTALEVSNISMAFRYKALKGTSISSHKLPKLLKEASVLMFFSPSTAHRPSSELLPVTLVLNLKDSASVLISFGPSKKIWKFLHSYCYILIFHI